jgi:hypothetical protein
MRQVFFALLFASVIGSAFVYSQDKATFREAQGFMPGVVRVTAKMPDKDRICIEIPGGLDACRTIGELRAWIPSRSAK